MTFSSSLKFHDNNSNINKNFIGQGSYGCTYFPGIDCSTKKNQKKYLTKVEEINFYSNNEIIISKMVKKISKYSKYFSPILKNCLISFDKLKTSNLELSKCQTLFDGLSLLKKEANLSLFDKNIVKDFIHKKYYLFSIKFIKNISFKTFYKKSHTHIELFNNFFIIYLYLLNSIYILNKNNIIHNDLHYGNILIQKIKTTPIIIDFGLSYDKTKIFTQGNIIDLKYLKHFFMDFREDAYNHNLEKRFISFISYNKTQHHNINLNSNFQENKLIQENIDYFIHDSITTITNNDEIANFFTHKEIDYYKITLTQFYYKYLDKQKYKYYSDIINELLPFVFEFEDIYKLSINYLLIYYLKEFDIKKNNNLTNILNIFAQILKKILNPNPLLRLKIYEIDLIIKFIIKTINKMTFDTSEKYQNFYEELNKLINDNNLSKNIIFQKDFAFIDFDSILNQNTINFIKKSNIKI